MICKNCNAENTEGSKFCQECGAALEQPAANGFTGSTQPQNIPSRLRNMNFGSVDMQGVGIPTQPTTESDFQTSSSQMPSQGNDMSQMQAPIQNYNTQQAQNAAYDASTTSGNQSFGAQNQNFGTMQPPMQNYNAPTPVNQPVQMQGYGAQNQGYNGQGNGYGGNPYMPAALNPDEKTANNLATISLLLGILSIFSTFCCLPIIPAVAAIVLAILAKNKGYKGPLATAGLFCGIAGIVITVLILILAVSTSVLEANYHF